jgi:hypothetical protein
MKRILSVTAVGIALAVATTALAGPAFAGMKPEVRFPKGAASTVLKGAIAHRDNDVWRVAGKAGQTLKVDIAAPERNAVFEAYAPGARMGHDAYGWSFAGQSLPGAEPGKNARSLVAKLPTTGMYLIVVGASAGNAHYSMTVSIR